MLFAAVQGIWPGVEGVWVMYGLTSNDRVWTVEAMGHPTVLSGPGNIFQSPPTFYIFCSGQMRNLLYEQGQIGRMEKKIIVQAILNQHLLLSIYLFQVHISVNFKRTLIENINLKQNVH